MKITDDVEKLDGLFAEVMTRMHVRACTVAQMAKGITTAQARKLHLLIHHKSSPSGQQPMDFKWYLRDAKLRYHSVFFLALYKSLRREMSEAKAQVLAYFKYATVMGPESSQVMTYEGLSAFRGSEKDYVLPFSRASYLAKTYSEAKDNRGHYKCPLTVKKCRGCMALYLGMRDTIEPHCPTCEAKADADRH